MKKKRYIIVGDNNFWYATTGEITAKELKTEIKYVKENIDVYEHDVKPSQLFVYEATEIKRVKV